jgi:2-aminoadipate transaminase
VTLPPGNDTTKLLPLAVKQKVAFVPGSPFYPTGGGENTMRMNFSNASPEGIREGMRRRGGVLKENIH